MTAKNIDNKISKHKNYDLWTNCNLLKFSNHHFYFATNCGGTAAMVSWDHWVWTSFSVNSAPELWKHLRSSFNPSVLDCRCVKSDRRSLRCSLFLPESWNNTIDGPSARPSHSRPPTVGSPEMSQITRCTFEGPLGTEDAGAACFSLSGQVIKQPRCPTFLS